MSIVVASAYIEIKFILYLFFLIGPRETGMNQRL